MSTETIQAPAPSPTIVVPPEAATPPKPQNGVAVIKHEVACDANGALVPRSIDQMWRVATLVVKSSLAPKSFKTVEQVVLAIAHGAELGLKPLQALQALAVVNGKVTVYGDAQLALVRPSLDEWREWFEDEKGEIDESKPGSAARIAAALKAGTLTAVCQGRRKGQTDVAREYFSIDDAKNAGLWTKEGPWKQYPRRMLRWRARGWALRALASDLLGGLLSSEEVGDMEPRTPEYEVRRTAPAQADAPIDGEAPTTEATPATDETPRDEHGNPLTY